jgi:hypothetical protein
MSGRFRGQGRPFCWAALGAGRPCRVLSVDFTRGAQRSEFFKNPCPNKPGPPPKPPRQVQHQVWDSPRGLLQPLPAPRPQGQRAVAGGQRVWPRRARGRARRVSRGSGPLSGRGSQARRRRPAPPNLCASPQSAAELETNESVDPPICCDLTHCYLVAYTLNPSSICKISSFLHPYHTWDGGQSAPSGGPEGRSTQRVNAWLGDPRAERAGRCGGAARSRPRLDRVLKLCRERIPAVRADRQRGGRRRWEQGLPQ